MVVGCEVELRVSDHPLSCLLWEYTGEWVGVRGACKSAKFFGAQILRVFYSCTLYFLFVSHRIWNFEAIREKLSSLAVHIA